MARNKVKKVMPSLNLLYLDIGKKVKSSKADKLRQNCILDIKTDKKVGN